MDFLPNRNNYRLILFLVCTFLYIQPSLAQKEVYSVPVNGERKTFKSLEEAGRKWFDLNRKSDTNDETQNQYIDCKKSESGSSVVVIIQQTRINRAGSGGSEKPEKVTDPPTTEITDIDIEIEDEVKVAAKGEEGGPARSNGSSNSTLPKIGEELSVPYKDGRARAKVVDTSGRVVTVLEKSKSVSGDVKHSILKETFSAQLASKEIIRWTEERTRLMANRPPYKKGLVETVWNNAQQPDGSVRDPAEPFEKLEWVEGKNRYTQWHMGHVNDHQYSKLVDEFIDGKIDWDKFIDEYNKAENYAPELPIKNMRKGVNAEPKPQERRSKGALTGLSVP